MPSHERSTFGCWTCRVRKKKCDEGYPLCSSCNIRGLTCYGYGPKPDWMDGSQKQQKVAEELRGVIKRNSKEKRSLHSGLPKQYVTTTSFQYGERPLPSVSTFPTPHASNTTELSSRIFPDSHQFEYTSDVFPSTPLRSDSHYQDGIPRRDPKEVETTLLINYLDHVFPLQFSCYTLPVTELGRGWLLALLTRTKPLYHIALALSAFYMHAVLQNTGRTQCLNGYWEVIKTNHEKAFSELQVHLRELRGGDLKATIEIVACVIQLISFELLRGGTDSWQIHLRAASFLIPTLISHLSPSRPHSQPSCWTSSSSLSRFKLAPAGQEPNERPPDVDSIAYDFLVGTFIWYDVLAAASTQSPPFLLNSHAYLLSHNFQLHKITGCEKSVMVLIAQISELAIWKKAMKEEGRLSMKDLLERGTGIERCLEDAVDDVNVWLTKLANTDCAELCISRCFVLAAQTYLHVTISGPYPSLPEITASVTNTIVAFQELKDKKMMRNLVWPFCVTGCLATREQEGYFRELMKEVEGEEGMGNLWKAWEVVRECWRLRGEGKDADWVEAMRSLGGWVLLV